MTQKDYIRQILEPVVRPWIEQGDNFMHEGDGYSGHSPPRSTGNIIVDWKKKHSLDHYFNYPGLPDLAPIKDAWQPTR
jgi:hypothetical protein